MDIRKQYTYAWYLALFTILYNILEGLFSVFFGFTDESLTLLGFGFDSFIEVLSGIGVAHMITMIRNNPHAGRDDFENTALKITGVSFYILTAGLVISSAYSIYTGHKPITTLWGIIISLLSIVIMYMLVLAKRKVGKNLDSKAILADAECTIVCIYMSIILLFASLIYEFVRIPYIDSLGTLGLAFYSFKEGRECFEKVKSGDRCVCDINERKQ